MTCVAAVAAVVAVYLRRKQRTKTIAQWSLVLGLLEEEDAIMSQDGMVIYTKCNVSYSEVLGTYYMLLEFACTALFV